VNKQLGMLTVVATVLLSAAFLTIPTMKVANAQENETESANQTKTIDVEGWINTLKESNPTLAGIEQSPDVNDAIGKIKEMQDPQEAVKTLDALYSLQQLMNLKSLNEAQ
jgi:guanyl-specific ribonuclease Sa